MILSDGVIGQMMEKVYLRDQNPQKDEDHQRIWPGQQQAKQRQGT